MPYADFSGREMIRALKKMGFHPVSRSGSHVKMRYKDPNTGEVRNVSVPIADSDDISQDTYRSIASQSGANDFGEWCEWIRDLC